MSLIDLILSLYLRNSPILVIRLQRLLVPFVLGVLLALWFFSVRYSDETDLFASVLRDGLLDTETVQGDVLYGFDSSDFVVESYTDLNNVDYFTVLVAYDPDAVALVSTGIQTSGSFTIEDLGGALSLEVGGLVNLKAGDEIVRIPVEGDIARVVLSEISVVFVDGSTKQLAIYNATPCLGAECDHHENS